MWGGEGWGVLLGCPCLNREGAGDVARVAVGGRCSYCGKEEVDEVNIHTFEHTHILVLTKHMELRTIRHKHNTHTQTHS